MKKSKVQKIFNIIFYVLFLISLFATSSAKSSFILSYDDFEGVINLIAIPLNISIGFFHFIAYKYSNTCKHFTTAVIVISGIVSFGLAYENSYFKVETVAYIVIWTLMLLLHLHTCKFVGEIKTHEFNVKMEDGRYEKVVVKEKIKDDTNAIGPVDVIKKAVKLVAIIFAVCFVVLIGFIIFFMVDDTISFEELKESLSDELVSSEYYENFNINDYTVVSSHLDYGEAVDEYSLYLGDVIYCIDGTPTRLISNSETATITYDSLWQLGDDDKFIIGINPDFGSYWLEIYMKDDADLPDENDKVIKISTDDDKVISFTDEQMATIMNIVKEFDNTETIVETENWDTNNSEFINTYRLYFYFENYDNMKVSYCELVRDNNGQWYLISEGYMDSETTHKLEDLEKLPQDICDTINESLK